MTSLGYHDLMHLQTEKSSSKIGKRESIKKMEDIFTLEVQGS